MPAPTLPEDLRLLALPPDVSVRLGLDGRVRAVSASVADLLGYSPAALVGRPALELVHPSDREPVERALHAGMLVSDVMSLEMRLVRAAGTVLRADVRCEAVRDADGAAIGHRVIVRDALDRHRAEELRTQWELLFHATRRGIAVTDPATGILVAVNPAFAAMHGGAVEDFVGLPVACVLAPSSVARIDALAEQIDRADFLTYESEHLRTDGTTFPAGIEVMAGRDEHGEQAFWLTWVEDLTERRRAERDAARHAQELARSNADLDRFAGVVSHDLQSPLRLIAGCARVLERSTAERLDVSERELVAHIVGGVNRMTRLLDGIREYSRVREEDSPLQTLACREVVEEVLESLSADLDAADATVRVGPLPTLGGHPVQLAQLFQNLIENAVKFRDAAPPEIAVSARRRDAEWEFTVADNGVGIDPRHAERVFDFGQRLHSDDDVPGTGIGLTVCKTVVERHGGRIWVEPDARRGSRFRFTLPA